MPASLIQNARWRLNSDHHTLGKVTADLLQVESAMSAAEVSVFGKVMNIEAVRSLYNQHQAVEAMNAKLKLEIQALQHEVVSLEGQVAVAHQGNYEVERSLVDSAENIMSTDGSIQAAEQKRAERIAYHNQLRKTMTAEAQHQQETQAKIQRLEALGRYRQAQEAQRMAERQAQREAQRQAQLAAQQAAEQQRLAAQHAQQVAEQQRQAAQHAQQVAQQQQQAVEQAQHARAVAHARAEAAEQQEEAKITQQLGNVAHDIPMVKVNNTMLKMERQQLLKQSARAAAESQSAIAELLATREQMQGEFDKQVPLRKLVVELHQNGTICRGIAGGLTEKLKAEQNALPVELEASRTARHQAESAVQAGEQRLLAEQAILKDQVLRAENVSRNAFTMISQAKQRLMMVEESIISAIKNNTEMQKATKEHTISVNSSLQDNIAVKKQDLIRKNNVRMRVIVLQEKLSPFKIAAIQSENNAYANELSNTISMLNEAKAAESVSISAQDQLESEVKAMQGQADKNALAVKEARTEGQKQIELAVKEASDGQAQAAELIQKAGDTLQAKCSAKWDKRGKAKQTEMDVCNQKKDALAVAKAQIATLEQTIQSQQAAGAAGR